MSRIKDWLMVMEDLAHEALNLEMNDKDAVEYMLSNMAEKSFTALHGTMQEVLRKVKEDRGHV
tara:strand:+ start:11843 stop:12031 length:189 start_codon:yes stop_codon:yes gene_type:complete